MKALLLIMQLMLAGHFTPAEKYMHDGISRKACTVECAVYLACDEVFIDDDGSEETDFLRKANSPADISFSWNPGKLLPGNFISGLPHRSISCSSLLHKICVLRI